MRNLTKEQKVNKFKTILPLFLFLLFIGCGDSDSDKLGLKSVKLNRDICTRCTMIISDPRYVSQVVMKNETKVFDDIGCAVHWVKDKKIKNFKIYVKDSDSNRYINAKDAYYSSGNSPMGYNFLAHKVRVKGAIYTYKDILNSGDKAHKHKVNHEKI